MAKKEREKSNSCYNIYRKIGKVVKKWKVEEQKAKL